MFKPDPTAKVVFYAIRPNLSSGVLDHYPYPTPRFDVERLPVQKGAQWRVNLVLEPKLGFTDNMTSRSDVLGFMLRAPRYIDDTNAATVRASVTKLLMHWAEMFPTGVPDAIID